MICRPGMWSTSRPSAGSGPGSSSNGCRICAQCCVSGPGATPSPRRPSWTAELYNRRRKAERGRAPTEANAGQAARFPRRSTHAGPGWRCTSLRPTSRTGHRGTNWRLKSRKLRATAWNGLMSIRATRAQFRRKPPNSTVGHEKSSNCRQRKRALCYCRAAGWWNAPAAGRRVSGAGHAMTNACPKTVAGLHFLAFACLLLQRFVTLFIPS